MRYRGQRRAMKAKRVRRVSSSDLCRTDGRREREREGLGRRWMRFAIEGNPGESFLSFSHFFFSPFRN
jgi:hypothetical protein